MTPKLLHGIVVESGKNISWITEQSGRRQLLSSIPEESKKLRSQAVHTGLSHRCPIKSAGQLQENSHIVSQFFTEQTPPFLQGLFEQGVSSHNAPETWFMKDSIYFYIIVRYTKLCKRYFIIISSPENPGKQLHFAEAIPFRSTISHDALFWQG